MPAAQARHVIVPADSAGQRIDKFLAEIFPDLSRSFIQRLIEEGMVTVNDKPAKASTRINSGDAIKLEIPPARPLELVPEAIPLNVVFEDDDLLVVDKPPGLVVHPAPGHATGTLVHALLGRYPELHVGAEIRPGIVHRLDKDTSGLMVIAKTDRALASLAQQIKDRTVLKEYLVLVHGRLPVKQGVIDAPIGRDPRRRQMMAVVPSGRPARTHYRVLQEFDRYTLVIARLETGRTHQIRVHFASIGHPVAGDAVYGPKKSDLPLTRQFLHAHRLGFRSPSSGQWLEFTSPLPPNLANVLAQLGAPQPSAQAPRSTRDTS